MSKVVEVMARGLDPEIWSTKSPGLTRGETEDFHSRRQISVALAKTTLAALDAAGFVVAPKEPTDEMLEASVSRDDWLTEAHIAVLKAGFGAKYRAMLAASQVTP